MSILDETFVYPLRVQFEDVDAAKAVYHPNYLCYLDRARAEIMRSKGLSIKTLFAQGYALVVAENHGAYQRSALLEDELFVITRFVGARRSSVRVIQVITREAPPATLAQSPTAQLATLPQTLYFSQMRLVCVALATSEACAFPPSLREAWALPAQLSEIPPAQTDVRLSVPWKADKRL